MSSDEVTHDPGTFWDLEPIFGVLGPLEVCADGELLHVGGRQIRTLLALLLVRPGQVMRLSTLVSSLWVGDPPPSADRTARTYMSRLRHALAPVAAQRSSGPLIVAKPPGYLLRIEPSAVDVTIFERLAVTGRRELTQQDPSAARGELQRALRLWRGEAYGEFGDIPLLRSEASRLEELRLSTVENCLQAELDIGLGPELVAELDGLVAGYPLRERLWVQYMIALYRSGRQAEALAVYLRARAYLATELGLQPSAELVDTHRRILAQDPQLLPRLTVRLNGPKVERAVSAQLLDRPDRCMSQVAVDCPTSPRAVAGEAAASIDHSPGRVATGRHQPSPDDGRRHAAPAVGGWWCALAGRLRRRLTAAVQWLFARPAPLGAFRHRER